MCIQKFFNKEPNYIKKPRIFGELGILKKNKKIFSKLENKGQTCTFVGYSDHHAADTYRLYMLGTGRVVIARDVLWMNVFFNNETRIDINNEGIDLKAGLMKIQTQNITRKQRKK